jgi:diaminopimelate decarboxylase
MAESGLQISRPFYRPQPGGALHCGGVTLESLAARFGTPLYVYSGDQIAERLAMFQQALAGRDHLVCYAVKANSALALLKLLAKRGAGFDIVSGGELERVWRRRRKLPGARFFPGWARRKRRLTQG